jgi:hypothetical protein
VPLAKAVATISIILILSPSLLLADVLTTNGSFESGDFTGWLTAGDTLVVNSSFGVTPANGTYQALISDAPGGPNVANKSYPFIPISSGAFNGGGSYSGNQAFVMVPFGPSCCYGMDTFLGLAPGSLSAWAHAYFSPSGFPVAVTQAGSAIQQSFTAAAGDLISFNFDYLTNFGSFAFLDLDGTLTVLSPQTCESYPGAVDGKYGSYSSPTGFQIECAQQLFSTRLDTTGTHTIAVGVIRYESDDDANSAILVDNFVLTAVPEPSTWLLLASGLVGIVVLKRRQLFRLKKLNAPSGWEPLGCDSREGLMTFGKTVAALVIILFCGSSIFANSFSNGSFETGNFSGWSTGGDTLVVNSSFGVNPAQGTFQALISNAPGVFFSVANPGYPFISGTYSGTPALGAFPDSPGCNPFDPTQCLPPGPLASFLGLPIGALSTFVHSVQPRSANVPQEGSAIQRTFTADAGDSLFFNFDYLTNDSADLAFVMVDGTFTLLGENSPTCTSYPRVSFGDGSTSSPTGFAFDCGQQTFATTFTTSGTHTIAIVVLDTGEDPGSNSAILVDNFFVTPEPSTWLLLASGLVGIVIVKRRTSRSSVPIGTEVLKIL